MQRDIVAFIPNHERIDETKKYIAQLAIHEIVTEVFIGEVIILESAFNGKYLYFDKAAPLELLLGLRSVLRDMIKQRSTQAQLCDIYQTYELLVAWDEPHLYMTDLMRDSSYRLRLDRQRFQRHLDRCCRNLRRHLMTVFPELVSRPEGQELDRLFA